MTRKTDVPVTRSAETPTRTPATAWPTFGNLRDEMERLFDAFEPGRLFERGAHTMPAAALAPAIDMIEKPDAYSITAELPGLDAKDVEVKVDDGTLTISGEKTEETAREEGTYHVNERRWGNFRRTVRLPRNVDRDKIDAKFAKGVLTVTLPKSAAALAAEKTIEVKAA
ncbi:Hsp20 family protein [Rhodobacterales bacterium HKCCE3408]|nr:Hsp20 family protein [Rhodobacterales bacterium HKCCE3408]